MTENINEKISVLVAFMPNKALPLSFLWQNQKYSIDKVNLVHSSYDGRGKIYYFSVMSAGNYFKLCFNTEKNFWLLAEAEYGT